MYSYLKNGNCIHGRGGQRQKSASKFFSVKFIFFRNLALNKIVRGFKYFFLFTKKEP